jgi:lipopolysaccharide transport protein LptA
VKRMLGVPAAGCAALALLGAGCADRAYAASACAERPVATDLHVAVEPADGDKVELHAAAAQLDPGFPRDLVGTFDDASLAISPPPSPAERSAKEAQSGDATDLDTFSVRARRMQYDSRGGRASFSGEVRITLGTMAMSCDALEVTYHRAEGTVDFVATGNVRVEREGLLATAGKAQYEGALHALTLTESPHVEGDVGVLDGARIVLDVEAETVTVEEVRGTFRVQQP